MGHKHHSKKNHRHKPHHDFTPRRLYPENQVVTDNVAIYIECLEEKRQSYLNQIINLKETIRQRDVTLETLNAALNQARIKVCELEKKTSH